MSEELHAQFFPMSLPAGVLGQRVERAEAAAEIQSLNAQIFGQHEARLFQVPPERLAETQRLRQGFRPAHPECIVFYADARQPVGWFYSYSEDPVTRFVDTVGFIPAYQGRGLFSAFLPKYLAYTAAQGYERVSTSHHPNNRAIMIAELRAGFDIVGLELHESHGPLIKLAYFVYADRRDGFERVFGMAPDPAAAHPPVAKSSSGSQSAVE